VPVGESLGFTLLASNYHHAAIVDLDGVTVWTGAVTRLEYALSNVVSRHGFDASFRENLAANDTPEWWLASAHPAWTNAFDVHALGDYDADGMPTWAEYVAGTHPTNAADVLRLHLASVTTNGTPAVALSWKTRAGRTYGLYTTTSLVENTWHEVSRTGGTGGAHRHVDPLGNGAGKGRLYRVDVSLRKNQ